MFKGRLDMAVALALLAWCVLVFASCRYEAHYPMNYHWDEMSKAAQVKEGWRNFNHPLFILNTTEASMNLLSNREACTYTQVTHLGRTLSAFWVALAVWCLSVLAYRQAGWMAALVVAVLSGLSMSALEAGHIFKEHAAVLLGISVALLGMDAYVEKRNLHRALWMGLAVGFSLSTKYAAVIVLPFWIWMLFLSCDRGRLRAVLMSLAGVAAAFVAVNFHPNWFGAWAGYGKIVNGEISLLIHGHHGAGVSIPHGIFWERWRAAESRPYFICAVAAPWLLLIPAFRDRESRAASLARAGLLFIAVANTAAISFVAKLSHEYIWPTLFFMSLPVGVLAGRLVQMAGRSPRKMTVPLVAAAVAAGFVFLALGQFSAWRQLIKGYQSDARQDLVRYIRREVPPDALIAQDQFVGLACPGDLFLIEAEKQVPHKIMGGYFLADMGTVDELKSQGVRYVAINMEQGCHYLEMQLISSTSRDEFQRRRQFYDDLEQQAVLVWESKTGEPVEKLPWLRFYRIRGGSDEVMK